MKKGLAVALVAAILSTSAFAGQNAGVGKAAIHCESHTAGRGCVASKGMPGLPEITDCESTFS